MLNSHCACAISRDVMSHMRVIAVGYIGGYVKFKYIYVKKTYQFKIHCKDDVMISLH